MQSHIFHGDYVFCGEFPLHMETTLQYVSILLSIVIHILLRHNYSIYLCNEVTFLDDVRLTLYFRTSKLRKKLHYKSFHSFIYVCLQRKNEKISCLTRW